MHCMVVHGSACMHYVVVRLIQHPIDGSRGHGSVPAPPLSPLPPPPAPSTPPLSSSSHLLRVLDGNHQRLCLERELVVLGGKVELGLHADLLRGVAALHLAHLGGGGEGRGVLQDPLC